MNTTNRPRVLEALCLLSFIGSGGGFLLYLSAAVFYPHAREYIVQFSSMESADQLSPFYFLLLSILFALSLLGVARMWKLRRSGFYIYVLAQLSTFSLPLAWLGLSAFSSVALIFTVLFIAAYGFQFYRLYDRSGI